MRYTDQQKYLGGKTLEPGIGSPQLREHRAPSKARPNELRSTSSSWRAKIEGVLYGLLCFALLVFLLEKLVVALS
jgi:hypothetical protein